MTLLDRVSKAVEAADIATIWDEYLRQEAIKDAVLEEVAKFCDELAQTCLDQHHNFFGTFGGFDHGRNEGAFDALDIVTGACRGEET